MSDGMGREFTYLSSHATNRYFIPNWGKLWLKFERSNFAAEFKTLNYVLYSKN